MLLIFVPSVQLTGASIDGSNWWNTEYNTTEGKDFWVTFMRNGGGDESDKENMSFYVYVASRSLAHVTFTNPNTSYTQSLIVNPGNQDFVKIPLSEAYMQESDDRFRGIHITSDANISVYITNHKQGFFDGTNVLPTPALLKEYVIQTYMADIDATEFAIVATKNNQRVDISIKKTWKD